MAASRRPRLRRPCPRARRRPGAGPIAPRGRHLVAAAAGRMIRLALVVPIVTLLPLAVSCALLPDRGGLPWYEARRDSSGQAPDPATTPEAVVQVYAARTVGWRG